MNDLFKNRLEKAGAIECLGATFPSDQARREHFLKLLAERLKDPAFRKQEDFPIGTDEAILAISDPPYYTACPNPFLASLLEHVCARSVPLPSYAREPFIADVSEGKNDPVYTAHSYHTKVPHKAVMRYILHYTNPGDVVFDGFCGSGMTGVAARLCGDRHAVQELGYRVLEDGTILKKGDPGSSWEPFSKLGERAAVLGDLSPAATFIAHSYNSATDPSHFEEEARRALMFAEEQCGWMFTTLHRPNSAQIAHAIELIAEKSPEAFARGATIGRINYTLWSDVFLCPECTGEFVFWDAAVDPQTNEVQDRFDCPHCHALLSKATIERVQVRAIDPISRQKTQQAKQVPALISYVVGKKKLEKKPDAFDLALLKAIDAESPTCWIPNVPMMFKGERWGATRGVPATTSELRTFTTSTHVAIFFRLGGIGPARKLSTMPRTSRPQRLLRRGSIDSDRKGGVWVLVVGP